MGVSVDTSQSNGIEALVAIIENSDLYRERLTAFQAAKAKLDASIALAGPANDILRLRNETQANTDASAAALADAQAKLADADAHLAATNVVAKDQATAIVADAEAQAEQIKSDAAQERARLLVEAEQRLAAATVAEQTNQTRATDLANREQTVKAREDAADALMAEAQALKADLDARIAKVTDALNAAAAEANHA